MTGVSSGSIISVHSDPSVTVDLVARTCFYGWWHVNGFPYAHAVAAASVVLKLTEHVLVETNGSVSMYF